MNILKSMHKCHEYSIENDLIIIELCNNDNKENIDEFMNNLKKYFSPELYQFKIK